MNRVEPTDDIGFRCVCTHDDCKRFWTLDAIRDRYPERMLYEIMGLIVTSPRVCHTKDPCVETECNTIKNIDLKRCHVMLNGICTKCSHSFNEHMHITGSPPVEVQNDIYEGIP